VQALGQDKFLALINRIVNAHQQASTASWHSSRMLSIYDKDSDDDKC